jgi:hypothetical protein
MPWVRIDDGFVDHPKIARVGAMGAWLQLQALCYANRNLTDGFVPQDVAESFGARGVLYVDADRRRWKLGQTCGVAGRHVTEVDWPGVMVESGLWEEVPGGYRIHDFDRYQPSKAQVLAERHRAADGMRKLRAQRSGKTGDQSCYGVSYAAPVPVPVPRRRSPDALHAKNGHPDRTGRRQRRGIAEPATGPRGGDPVRLGDVLADAVRRTQVPP